MLNGLLGTDWNDPRTMATFNLAAGLMSGRGFGDGVSRGLAAYQQTMSNAEESAARKQEREYLNLMRKVQMDELIQKQQRQKRADEWRAQLPGLMVPKLQGTDPVTNQIAAENAEFGDFGVQKLAELRSPLAISYGPDQKALQSHLMSPDSPFADKLIERKLFPKEREDFTLGEGQVRYSGDGKQIAAGPAKSETPTPGLKEYEYAKQQGFQGSFFDFKREIARAGASNQVVKLPAFESEQDKTYGKAIGELRSQITNAGFTAPSTLSKLDRMEKLLTGAGGGALSPTGMQIASAAKSLGINLDPKLGDKQAAEALAIELALSMREPGSGPMTDKDFQNFMNAVPSLAKTPEGRAQIFQTMRNKAKRDVEVSRMMREYAQRNGGRIDEGFFDVISDHYAKNPVFVPQGGNSDLLNQADAIVNGKR